MVLYAATTILLSHLTHDAEKKEFPRVSFFWMTQADTPVALNFSGPANLAQCSLPT